MSINSIERYRAMYGASAHENYSQQGSDRDHLRACVSAEVADLAIAAGHNVDYIGGGVTPIVPRVTVGTLKQLEAAGHRFARIACDIGSRLELLP